MSNLEAHGNGLSGRVDGPLFDARHVLVPAALAFGTIGEVAQTEIQEYETSGRPLPDTGFVGDVIQLMGSMPLDAKAVGLACGVAATTQLVQAARNARNINFENVMISSGIPSEQAVEPVNKRGLKRLGSWALAGVSGVAAYKVGENLSPVADIVASTGIIGAGTVYMGVMKKRLSGHW